MNKEIKRRRIRLAIVVIVLLSVFSCITISFSANSSIKIRRNLQLGQKYLSELKYEQAVASFKAAIDIDPMSQDAINGLVESYDGWSKELIRAKEYERAIIILNEAFDEFPENEDIKAQLVKTYISAADSYFYKKDYDEAIRLLEEGLERTHSEKIEKHLDTVRSEKEKRGAVGKINDDNLQAFSDWLLDCAKYDLLGKPAMEWTYADILAALRANSGELVTHNLGETTINGVSFEYSIVEEPETNDYWVDIRFGSESIMIVKQENEVMIQIPLSLLGIDMTWHEMLSKFNLEGIVDYWNYGGREACNCVLDSGMKIAPLLNSDDTFRMLMLYYDYPEKSYIEMTAYKGDDSKVTDITINIPRK